MGTVAIATHREPWNKGQIVGQMAPFKLKDIWALRVRLQMVHRVRELALFKLRHKLAFHWRDLEVEPCKVTVHREPGRAYLVAHRARVQVAGLGLHPVAPPCACMRSRVHWPAPPPRSALLRWTPQVKCVSAAWPRRASRSCARRHEAAPHSTTTLFFSVLWSRRLLCWRALISSSSRATSFSKRPLRS